MHLTHTVTVKNKDGTDVNHTAEALLFIDLADGAVAVEAHCCGDASTASRHTFYDIAAMHDDAIRQEVQGHVERVAQHHAFTHRARQGIASLVKG
jgi:hypothetical protein